MSEPAISITDVVRWIQESSSEGDFDVILKAINTRARALLDQAAANVRTGSRVRTHSLKPKYLNGLTGTVKTIETERGKRLATVSLDADSISKLGTTQRYGHLWGQEKHDFAGIPVHCLTVVDED
ncbi:hypothetical protein LZ318_30890 [Saccharopolyspora indica]|uniref:hypothetical protein n=1 Tax=Saccharopolyspora indica TaxID=1229659 RepID=UPI0022EB26AB|nr:hypothetical protein [Saccharopolyspora indica]MDA3644360.1 hypothetical protein [Saccharopolyspora indica]